MKPARIILTFLLLTFTSLCSMSQDISEENAMLIGGRCEGCEAVFEYGDQTLSPVDTLPDFNQAKEKLKVTGTIYQHDGETFAEDVILFIYQTDAEGVYPTKGDETGWAQRQGYLRGWIKTDHDGEYTFYTQKPGSYGQNPAHIHTIVLEPDGKYYWIDDYLFKGDPLLPSNHEQRGGSGIVELKQENDLLVAERDIILGLNVPGYE